MLIFPNQENIVVLRTAMNNAQGTSKVKIPLCEEFYYNAADGMEIYYINYVFMHQINI